MVFYLQFLYRWLLIYNSCFLYKLQVKKCHNKNYKKTSGICLPDVNNLIF